jgi:hypothetical protein
MSPIASRIGNPGHRPVVSAAMTTPSRPPRALLATALTLLIAAAGCSSGAAPSASRGGSATPASPSASIVPSAAPSASDVAGGGTSGDPGTGIGVAPDPTPVDPAAPSPTLVMPKPGRLDPHPVGAQRLEASVDGRHVLVKVTWTSGVEPCNVLDSVKVETSGHEISLTVIEGSSDKMAMCIEIAMDKATIVDLGELQPGTWTIRSTTGEATPIKITVA